MIKKPGTIKQGFTLLELLIAVAITGVLLAMGVPSMLTLVYNQKVKSAIDDIHISLIQARSEAIKRNANISLIPNISASFVGAWRTGWRIVTPDGTILKIVSYFTNIEITGPIVNVVYMANGRLANGVSDYRVYISGNASVPMRCVVISPNGSPHTKIDTDNNTSNGCN